jgi:imidazolonepropionase-like amidohydrolase
VIQSASAVTAELLLSAGGLGVIAVGAYADLLVVEGDPLADLCILADPKKNLKLVMKDGKIYKNEL